MDEKKKKLCNLWIRVFRVDPDISMKKKKIAKREEKWKSIQLRASLQLIADTGTHTFEYYRSIRNTQYVISLRYIRILNMEKENIHVHIQVYIYIRYIYMYTIRDAVHTLIYVYIYDLRKYVYVYAYICVPQRICAACSARIAILSFFFDSLEKEM